VALALGLAANWQQLLVAGHGGHGLDLAAPVARHRRPTALNSASA
jgi:hypothetical protein